MTLDAGTPSTAQQQSAARQPTGVPGADIPDARGRTGLHRTGLDLTGNPRVRVAEVQLLSSNWHVFRANTLEYQRADGEWETQHRETYDRGNGATILLYSLEKRTVLLTRQFRYPAYVNGHPDGNLIETAAGLLDDDDPLTAIRREAREETGHDIGEVTPVFEAYMSPGSVTEKLFFFAAPYSPATRADAGGGLAEEGEEIELLELDIDDALDRIGVDIIDAKTIMLLQWAALRGPFAR
jgi:nudix-type nucleoside diphosphatase (YffH/AdpP family)